MDVSNFDEAEAVVRQGRCAVESIRRGEWVRVFLDGVENDRRATPGRTEQILFEYRGICTFHTLICAAQSKKLKLRWKSCKQRTSQQS